jgi:hypothetical protein
MFLGCSSGILDSDTQVVQASNDFKSNFNDSFHLIGDQVQLSRDVSNQLIGFGLIQVLECTPNNYFSIY